MRKRCVQTCEKKSLTQKLVKEGLRKTTKRVLSGVLAAAMVLTSGVVIPQNKTVAEAAGGITVGSASAPAVWGDYANFYNGGNVSGDFSETYSFHCHTLSSVNWEGPGVGVTPTSLGKTAADVTTDFYVRSDVWADGAMGKDSNTGTTRDYGNINWDTFNQIKADCNVSVTVARTNTTLSVAMSCADADGRSYNWSISIEQDSAEDMTIYIGGTNCYLTPVKTVRTITVKHVKASDGSAAAADITKNVFEGDEYSITPAEVSGLTPDVATVTGVAGNADETKTVTYTSAAQHELTIKYVNQAGTAVADDVVKQIDEGKPYSVKSPTVAGYAPEKTTLTGTMGNADATVKVTYKPVIATVGSDNFDTAYNAYDKFYSVMKKAGDFSVSFSFHNDSAGADNWKNFATIIRSASGSEWYERADLYANSAFGKTSADVTRAGGPNWDTFLNTFKDAEVGVSVVRSGTTITISHNVAGANGESCSWTSTLTDCPTDVATIYLGCEAAKVSIYEATASDVFEKKTVTVHYVNASGDAVADDVVEEVEGAQAYSIVSPTVDGFVADKKTVSGTMGDENIEVTVTYKKSIATIGSDNGDGTYSLTYNDTANYYSITKTGDFTASYSFHNNSPGTDNWLNYAVIVRTGSGLEWYERADVYSNAPDWANTAFGNAITYEGAPDWATFADTIKDAEVGVTIQRFGDTMTISHNVTGANGVSYSWTSSAACPIDDVTIYLGGEACMLDVYTASESDKIAVEAYSVTVHYVYEDGSKAADDVVRGPLSVGATYYIPSPEIEGYKADLSVISGTIGREPVSKTVTYKTIKTDPIASVGKNEDGSYDLAFGDVDNYYEVPVSGDFEITFQFHQEGEAANNWESYAVVVRNAAGLEWYLRGDYYSFADGWTNTAFGNAVTYGGVIDWDSFLDTMKDADCTVQVTRSGSTMTISNVVAGTNGVSFAWTASVKDCPTDDLSVWLGGEKVALTLYDASVKSDAPQPTVKPSEPTAAPSEPTTEPTAAPSEPTAEPTAAPSEPTSTPAVEKGDKVSNSNGTYKVTDTSKKTVKYVDDKGSKKKAAVPNAVKVNGKNYKVTAVAKNAFKGNSKLTKVTIGKNVTKIEAGAFKNCKNLKTIVVNSVKLTSVGKDALKGTNAKLVIKVPAKKLAAYQKLFAGKGNVSVVVK